jgi:hypothetical protein
MSIPGSSRARQEGDLLRGFSQRRETRVAGDELHSCCDISWLKAVLNSAEQQVTSVAVRVGAASCRRYRRAVALSSTNGVAISLPGLPVQRRTTPSQAKYNGKFRRIHCCAASKTGQHARPSGGCSVGTQVKRRSWRYGPGDRLQKRSYESAGWHP